MNEKFDEIVTYAKHKTRVLVFSSYPSVSQLLLEVLDFNSKDFDFFLQSGESSKSANDFVILETSKLEKALTFQPNIVLITDETQAQDLVQIGEKMTAGGVFIYSDDQENAIDSLNNFVRKMPFNPTDFKKHNEGSIIETDFGGIPTATSNENLLRNLNGLKLLAQQFGVMESEFYEPLMGFNQ